MNKQARDYARKFLKGGRGRTPRTMRIMPDGVLATVTTPRYSRTQRITPIAIKGWLTDEVRDQLPGWATLYQRRALYIKVTGWRATENSHAQEVKHVAEAECGLFHLGIVTLPALGRYHVLS